MDIITNSIAAEIIGHVYPDAIADSIKNVPGLKNFSKEIISHTSVIDIGTKAVDSNRQFWDVAGSPSFG